MSNQEGVRTNRGNFKDFLLKASKEYVILIALIAAVIVFTITSEYFFTANNLMNILLQCSTIGIVAIGQAFVCLSGNLDLSLGQSVCLSCYVSAILMKTMGMNPWLALLVCMAIAITIGVVNGILVAYLHIPTFIGTLGMQLVCTGLAKIISGSATIAPLPDAIEFLGRGYIFTVVPVSVVIMAAVYVIASFIAKKTVLGRYIYSIGGSKEAAFYSGIKVQKYTLISFIIAGICVGIGSVVLLSRLDAASISNGKGYEFDAVIGCVLGGISMSGGKGKVIQAFFGVLFLTVFFNGMTQLNVNPFVQDVIKGVVLIAAIAIDGMRNRVKN